MGSSRRLGAAVIAALVFTPAAAQGEESDSTASMSVGRQGLSLKSADLQNEIRFRGVLHVEGRYLDGEDSDGESGTWEATRIRPTIEGTLGSIYDFKFMPDYGLDRTVIQDAYVRARFNPAFNVTAGKFKSPVGLERLQSSSDTRFVARAFPSGLVPNRDVGVQFAGDLWNGRLGYAAAWLNGANDGSSVDGFDDPDDSSDPEYVLRLFSHPFAESDRRALRGLGVGVAGSYTDQTGTATESLLPAFRTPGQSTFFRYRAEAAPTVADGERLRFAPQLYYYAGRFGLIGEYTEVSQEVSRITPSGLREDSIDTKAWQLATSWFLTGEEATFRGFHPKKRFSLSGGTWGALEIVARVQALEIDDAAFAGGADSFADPAVAAREATSWGLGLNWYFNENLKWMIDYERTRFDGGAATGADREDEDALQLRIALGF